MIDGPLALVTTNGALACAPLVQVAVTEYVPGVPCETTVAGAPSFAIVCVPPIVSAIVIFPAGHPSTLTEAVTVVPDPEPVGLSLTVGADAAVALVLDCTVAVGTSTPVSSAAAMRAASRPRHERRMSRDAGDM